MGAVDRAMVGGGRAFVGVEIETRHTRGDVAEFHTVVAIFATGAVSQGIFTAVFGFFQDGCFNLIASNSGTTIDKLNSFWNLIVLSRVFTMVVPHL